MENLNAITPSQQLKPLPLPTQCLDKFSLGERLEVTPRIANELMRSGKIRSFKVGRTRVVSESALQEYIKKQEAKPLQK